MLDLIKRVIHEDFSLSPFNPHIWLNMKVSYLDEGLAIFYFYFVFSEK
jgi:hypothetical protein